MSKKNPGKLNKGLRSISEGVTDGIKKTAAAGVDLGKQGLNKATDGVSGIANRGKKIKKDIGERLGDIPIVSDIKIKKPSLERFGIWYFKRMRKRRPRKSDEVAVHILDKQERRKLKQIEIRAMVKAAIAGSISAFVAAWANMQKFYLIDDEVKDVITWDDYYEYYLFVGGITLAVTILEIAFIYWDSLRSVFKISDTADIPLFPDGENTSAMAFALARAALELPNPMESDVNVNPVRESPKWKILLAPLIYKLKIAVTNFIAKMIIRRTIGRGVARVYVEFIAIPVSAFWNAWVSWQVIRQARIRALGPSFALDFVNKLLAERDDFSPEAKAEMMRAIAAVIVRTENLHPNLEYLLHILMNRFQLESLEELDNTKVFLEDLKKLHDHEQEYVLQLLVVATIISGRLSRRHRKLLAESFHNSGYTFPLGEVKELKKDFFGGEPLEFPLLSMKLG